MTTVLEHDLIGRLAAGLPRSPSQINGLHESDAELIRLPGSDLVLALTTDALAEEIASGLYADPWLIGWMLVTVNASDLAAVGADPLGLLVCETLPPDADPEWIAALQRGIADAAVAHGLPVLGGDTNAGAVPHLAATAVGLVRGRLLTRCGARPGDLLFASGPLGAGGAYALSRLAARGGTNPAEAGPRRVQPVNGRGPHVALATDEAEGLLQQDPTNDDTNDGSAPAVSFQPTARLREGALLREVASACMDTSDGAIATMDELMMRNGVGFRIESPVEAWTDPAALSAAYAAALPPWMLHAGPHGEFELLFTVPPERVQALDDAAGAIGWHPLCLGVATTGPGLTAAHAGGYGSLDATRIRNLFTECGGNPRRYLEELRNIQWPMSNDRQ
jgi:thiamine-monophosphate kinase